MVSSHIFSYTLILHTRNWGSQASYMICSGSQLNKFQSQNPNTKLLTPLVLTSSTVPQQWYIQILQQAPEHQGTGRHAQSEASLLSSKCIIQKGG